VSHFCKYVEENTRAKWKFGCTFGIRQGIIALNRVRVHYLNTEEYTEKIANTFDIMDDPMLS
jgi:hypothetical protein